MKILGIDTSMSCGSVGLIDDGEVISDYLLNVAVTHSERLLGTIELVLREARCPIGSLDGWRISLRNDQQPGETGAKRPLGVHCERPSSQQKVPVGDLNVTLTFIP